MTETYFHDPDATRTAAQDMAAAGEAIEAAFSKYGPSIEALNNDATYGADETGEAFKNGAGEEMGYHEAAELFLTDAPSAGEGVRVTGEAVEATVDSVVGMDQIRRKAIDNSVKPT